MKRTGTCFDDALTAFFAGRYPDAKLVHGLPTGLVGDAAKAGQYPHAWIEYADGAMVWDPVADVHIEARLYYTLGRIEYTVEYDFDAMCIAMIEHSTAGPWDQVLLDRDEEIEQMIQAAEGSK